jgi:hypothetical protein
VSLWFVIGIGYSALRAGLPVRCAGPRVMRGARARAFNIKCNEKEGVMSLKGGSY